MAPVVRASLLARSTSDEGKADGARTWFRMDTSGLGEACGRACRRPPEPHRRRDDPVRRLDAVRLHPHRLVHAVDRTRRGEVSLRAPDDAGVAGGDLPVDVRDDQPEPRRREAGGTRGTPLAARPGRGEAERGAHPHLAADPRGHERDPFAHEGRGDTVLSKSRRLRSCRARPEISDRETVASDRHGAAGYGSPARPGRLRVPTPRRNPSSSPDPVRRGSRAPRGAR